MASPADRFTQMQKVAVFLIVLGAERTREVLVDLDFDTLEAINRAISSVGELTPQEKASVMIEFGDMFFKDLPLKSKLVPPTPGPAASPSPPAVTRRGDQSQAPPRPTGNAHAAPLDSPGDRRPEHQPPPAAATPPPANEEAVRQALRHLKQHVDPGKIDWGRAGYDFGEGFRGRTDDRNR